jgi:UDP-glucose 4-epimerase
MKNKKIFITGGAGFLGKGLIEKWNKDNEITVFSRDEAKHYFVKKKFPNVKFIIGDVANLYALSNASKNHDIGIFAASLKQIEAVDSNVAEAAKTIINGGINSRIVAEENFESACFISSDKSRAATTIYGAMKFVAGESFIVNSENSRTKLSTAIYGNVLNSTGSIIPLIWDSIKNKYPLSLYGENMTRFAITLDEAISLLEFAVNTTSVNVIPKLQSIKIKDLFDIYKQFGLQYNIGQPRISEKEHEIMIAPEEVARTKEADGYYLMHYKNIYNEVSFPNNEFSSRDVTMSPQDLERLLIKNNFFA